MIKLKQLAYRRLLLLTRPIWGPYVNKVLDDFRTPFNKGISSHQYHALAACFQAEAVRSGSYKSPTQPYGSDRCSLSKEGDEERVLEQSQETGEIWLRVCGTTRIPLLIQAELPFKGLPRPELRIVPTDPAVTAPGGWCGLCDYGGGCSHPRSKCLVCGEVGLAENMAEHFCGQVCAL